MMFAMCRGLCVIRLSECQYELVSEDVWEEDRIFISVQDEYIER